MTGTVSTDLEVLSPQNGVAVAVEVNTTLKTMKKKSAKHRKLLLLSWWGDKAGTRAENSQRQLVSRGFISLCRITGIALGILSLFI
jgi:hypothetical protein